MHNLTRTCKAAIGWLYTTIYMYPLPLPPLRRSLPTCSNCLVNYDNSTFVLFNIIVIDISAISPSAPPARTVVFPTRSFCLITGGGTYALLSRLAYRCCLYWLVLSDLFGCSWVFFLIMTSLCTFLLPMTNWHWFDLPLRLNFIFNFRWYLIKKNYLLDRSSTFWLSITGGPQLHSQRIALVC